MSQNEDRFGRPGDERDAPTQGGMAGGGEATAEIQSVNSKPGPGNKVGKAVFILVCAALMTLILALVGQSYLNSWKQGAKGKRNLSGEVDPMNPEATRAPVTRVGAATGKPPPQVETAPAKQPGVPENDGVRPIRGADGKVLTDPQGRGMGVDTTGKVVAVPAITPVAGPSFAAPVTTPPAAVTPTTPPPSRYGGSLFVEQAKLGAGGGLAVQAGQNTPSAGVVGTAAAGAQPTSVQQQQLDMVRALMPGAQRPVAVPAPPPPNASPYSSQGAETTPGANVMSPGASAPSGAAVPMTTVASMQVSTRTPVARASFFPDQNLMLPKGRQGTCVLTTRIDDQLPGYTSCILQDDLYSDNGKTVLLEHGSEVWGEYGTIGQPGLNRIAVNWVRIKTRDGIVVDLSSPGTDALGGSGLPGHYNPRWMERIGTALLLSLVRDVTAAVINNQSRNSGSTVTVSPGGQNTLSGGSNIAEQVVRETLRVRPNTTVSEGSRIAIYVNRDLDFRPVYELRRAAAIAQAAAQ